eukprot:5646870-Prymnesium_polylepis.1
MAGRRSRVAQIETLKIAPAVTCGANRPPKMQKSPAAAARPHNRTKVDSIQFAAPPLPLHVDASRESLSACAAVPLTAPEPLTEGW